MGIKKNDVAATFPALDEDSFLELKDRLAEAEAIQEMASRMKNENCEDFEMLKNASRVTFRLLMEAREILEPRQ